MARRAFVIAFALACADLARAELLPIGRDIALVAERYLTARPALRREDCSGLVDDILRDSGVDERGGTRSHWERAQAEGRISAAQTRPGDLVFFDRTFDANHNGRVDDTLTHMAVVIDVKEDGTVIMVHRSASRIEELRMNLRAPDAHMVDDSIVNSYLRSPRYGTKSSPRLSGQLYRGHARPPLPQKRREVAPPLLASREPPRSAPSVAAQPLMPTRSSMPAQQSKGSLEDLLFCADVSRLSRAQ